MHCFWLVYANRTWWFKILWYYNFLNIPILGKPTLRSYHLTKSVQIYKFSYLSGISMAFVLIYDENNRSLFSSHLFVISHIIYLPCGTYRSVVHWGKHKKSKFLAKQNWMMLTTTVFVGNVWLLRRVPRCMKWV